MAKWVVLLAIASCVIVQLAVPPLVGMANNGDFDRFSRYFSLAAPEAEVSGETVKTEYGDLYFRHFISRYRYATEYYWKSGFLSSALLPIGLAVSVSRLVAGRDWFDIRFLSLLYTAMLVLVAWMLLTYGECLGRLRRWSLYVLLALILTDVGYVAYFNSFYGEPASFLFLLATVALTLHAVEKPTAGRIAGVFVCLALFATAKAQNTPSALVFLPVAWRLRRLAATPAAKNLCDAGVVLALLVSSAFLRAAPRGSIVDATYYVAVFTEILPHSPTPGEDLRDLGVDPALARYARTTPYSPGVNINGPELRSGFLDRISFARILKFYLVHPGRLWAALDRSAHFALLLRPGLGVSEAPAFGKFPPHWETSRSPPESRPGAAANRLGCGAAYAPG